jgi:hypothetical protein
MSDTETSVALGIEIPEDYEAVNCQICQSNRFGTGSVGFEKTSWTDWERP